MEVILLERIPRLGQMGDVVRVRDGYARNFLLPQGKALRSNESSLKRFESQRATLEARNLERKSEAEQAATKLNGQSFVVIRQAGETGQLYGSVSPRDLADAMSAAGFKLGRNQIGMNQPIKNIGIHSVAILLHPDVDVSVKVNVARSADEAERQTRGEDLTARQEFVMEREEGEEGEGGEASDEAAAEEQA